MFNLRSAAKITGAAAAMAIFSAMSGLAQEPITIKFSHVVAPDTPKGKGAEKFKELAEQYTDGRVTVEIYPNSQLYKDKEELVGLRRQFPISMFFSARRADFRDGLLFP